ncbi:MAG: FAD-dependent oxidoreductase [Chloroflexi bacterium]|nr:FAD-dependent oxidoreductase [Chloroflexota bacterium]
MKQEETAVNDYFDILFQPIQIGPVVAPNRFYQVPHCNGLAYRHPRALAAMRGIKAEGGWGVVCTEETQIHHTSDQTPYIEGRLWNDEDIPAMQLVTDAIHQHGALAGVQLAYHGILGSNLYSRVPTLGPRSRSIWGASGIEPAQSRRMDKEDIRNVLRWQREAALRAKQADFDIIYIYGQTLPWQFLSRNANDRTDEYGGSLENRVRFLRELIEVTRDAVGDRCGIALRLAVDELMGDDGISSTGEGYDIVSMVAELPDLWDVKISGWSNNSATSRFEKEGFQEQFINFVKPLTSKPVVGVGRYTSPESMVSLIRRGIMDIVGAARPSIADPHLPLKIKEGRFEDIRECIGCNICVTGDTMFMPIRCTQNPTMGEEWKRGWHPEIISKKKSDKEIVVVGSGPAGLECARALGARGYTVSLTEARRELGGRVELEAQLPGLIEWRRVVEWRIAQIEKMPNVTVYPGSKMSADAIQELGIQDVIIATGATWRRDGVGRSHWRPIPGHELSHVYTPDDIMADRMPTGKVIVFDDAHYYFGGVIAEKLARTGCEVTLITPASVISAYTQYTLEQKKVQKRLLSLGVNLHTQVTLNSIQSDHVTLSNDLIDTSFNLACDGIVMVVDRLPNDSLYQALKPELAAKNLKSLRVIGDADAPHIIERAVFAGHLAAREFDEIPVAGTPFKVERFA